MKLHPNLLQTMCKGTYATAQEDKNMAYGIHYYTDGSDISGRTGIRFGTKLRPHPNDNITVMDTLYNILLVTGEQL
jgi:hypothetical protein